MEGPVVADGIPPSPAPPFRTTVVEDDACPAIVVAVNPGWTGAAVPVVDCASDVVVAVGAVVEGDAGTVVVVATVVVDGGAVVVVALAVHTANRFSPPPGIVMLCPFE